ncbi:MAG: hypothetical protein JO084_00930 [Bradyrhizobiaceae bacterium]|nr:hypothetical protein [Bradyrhizobiaceae bacterium]
MSTSHSVAQVVAQTAADLDDAFGLPQPLPSNVYVLHPRRQAKPRPKTITECVPLMAVAAEFLNRGPDDLSIASVEAYRAKAIELLSEVKPVIERQAKMTLDEWAADVIAQPEIARTLT